VNTVWQTATVVGSLVDPAQHQGELSPILGTFPDDRPLHETWLARYKNGQGRPVNQRLNLYLFMEEGNPVWVLGVRLTCLDQRGDQGMSRSYFEVRDTFNLFRKLTYKTCFRDIHPRLTHFLYRTEVA